MFRWPPFGTVFPPRSRPLDDAAATPFGPSPVPIDPREVMQLIQDTLQLDKAGLREDNALGTASVCLALRRNTELEITNETLRVLCERIDSLTLALRDRI